MASDDLQQLLKARAEKLAKKVKPEKGIYSPLHALAKDISEYCGEPKEFAMYLGIVKNLGLRKAYRIFAEMRQNPSISTRGKFFLYKSKYKPDKPTTNKKRSW